MMPSIQRILLLCLLLPACAGAAVMKGNVLDAAGQPVPDATVWLTQDWQVQTTTTGSAGSFQFEKLGVGFATVVAWKTGYACGGAQGVFVDDAEVQIALVPAGELKLRILSSQYKSLAGARVKSMFVNGLFSVPVEDLTPQGFPSLRSNDEGLIVTDLLAAGGFVQLVVTHLDYADAYVAYLPVDNEQHEVVLESGISLTGRVTFEGAPVAGAVVQVRQLRTEGASALTETPADPEGFYHLRLPAGTYWLLANHGDYAPADPQEVVLQTDGLSVDLELRQPRTISGKIALPSGEGVGGAQVEFRREGRLHAQTFTRSDGAFTLETGYPVGNLVIQAPPGYVAEATSSLAGSALRRITETPKGYVTETVEGIQVDMKDEQSVRLSPIQLEKIPAVEGVVRDASGDVLANAVVTLLGGVMPLIALTNDEGRFRLQVSTLGPEGNYRLRAEHPARFLRADTEVDPRKQKDLDLRLKPFEPDQETRALGQNALSLAPLTGKAAPALTCDAWFNTQPLALDQLKGKVVVLTFWGGFDQSAYGLGRVLELNSLHTLFTRTGIDDVMIIGVHDASVEPEDVEEYLAQYKIAWPVGCDADPFKTFVTYGINFIPQTVLIDKEGMLRYHDVEGRLLELIKVLRRKT